MARATFGMGCYWAAEEVFRTLPGVTATQAGFSNGRDEGVSEAEVFSGAAGHAEVVAIDFDPARVSFEALLTLFWENHDAATPAKPIVRSAIFFHDEDQRLAAQASRAAQPGPVVTEIAPAGQFWRAPEKDQQYVARHAAQAAQ